MTYLSLALRLWLAGVCIVAAAGKVAGRRSFGDFVNSLELAARAVPLVRAPARFARLAALPTVAAELAVAALLPWPPTALPGSALAVALFGVFTAGVTTAVATGTEAPCACFGRISRTLGVEHIVRNAVLTAAAAVALGATLARGLGPVGVLGGVLAAFGAAVATLLIMFWSDITALLFAEALVVAELSGLETRR
jgi:hypothetical protein